MIRKKNFWKNELNKRYKDIPTFYFKNSKIVNNAINYGLSLLSYIIKALYQKEDILELFERIQKTFKSYKKQILIHIILI